MASPSPSGHVDIHHGRLRFVPGEGRSLALHRLQAVTFVLAFALGVVAIVDGTASPLMWIAFVVFMVGVVVRLVASWSASREASVKPPREPVTVPPTLVASIRELQREGRDIDAVKLVRAQLGVGIADGKKIADAARVSPS